MNERKSDSPGPHGFLSPAVALLSRLRYAQKFGLISVLFILPLGLMLGLLIFEINDRVRFAYRELEGTACLRPLRKLMEQFSLIQQADGMGSIRKEVALAFAELERNIEAGGDRFHLQEGFRVLQADWDQFQDVRLEAESAGTQAAFGKLFKDLRLIISHVGDASNLILDPDLDTYYLMDSILLKLPDTQELLVQFEMNVCRPDAEVSPTLDHAAELMLLGQMLQSSTSAVEHGMQVAFQNSRRPGLRPALEAPLREFAGAGRQLLGEPEPVAAATATPELPRDPRDMCALSARARSHSFELWDAATDELDRLLQSRIQRFRNREIQLGAFCAAVLLLVLYLFLGFYSSVMRTVSQLEDATSRMTDGEMAGSVRIETDDEMAQVVGSFNAIARELRREWVQAREESARARAAEEQLTVAKEMAEAANQTKTQFLANMSHELRTPLTAILGFGHLLERNDLSRDNRENVAHILKAGKHLLSLIDEILDIGRVEAGRINFNYESARAADVIGEVIALVRPLANDRRVTLHLVPDPDSRCLVHIDRQRFKQVLLNLLSNAVKYNREGGVVTIGCRSLPGSILRIAVSDTGKGIAEEHIAKVFEPFERLDADADGIEGSGLGLTLVHRLVYAMGGLVGVKSTLREGSTFWVEFPIAQASKEDAAEQISVLPEVPESKPSAPDAKVRILYIEDNPANLELVEKLLARRAHTQFLAATDGASGLAMARELHPTVILLDVQLPDTSGYDVQLKLQADPVAREIPVIVLSANAMPDDIRKMRDAGVREYLTKPLDIPRFFEVLDRLIDSATGRDTITEEHAEHIAPF